MSVERTREVVMQYWDHHDMSKIDEHAIFTVMGTGYEARGRAAIEQTLHYFYAVAFDADYSLKNAIFTDGQACFEADFVGKQLLEFAGVAPSDKEIRIPFCVIYELEHDLITRIRVYFETDALRQESNP